MNNRQLLLPAKPALKSRVLSSTVGILHVGSSQTAYQLLKRIVDCLHETDDHCTWLDKAGTPL